jgi:hypothetical protein
MTVAEQLGALVGWLLMPVLLLLLIGLIQYLRTGDMDAARQTATSWWALLLAVVFFLFSLVSRFVQTLT